MPDNLRVDRLVDMAAVLFETAAHLMESPPLSLANSRLAASATSNAVLALTNGLLIEHDVEVLWEEGGDHSQAFEALKRLIEIGRAPANTLEILREKEDRDASFSDIGESMESRRAWIGIHFGFCRRVMIDMHHRGVNTTTLKWWLGAASHAYCEWGFYLEGPERGPT